MAGCGVTWALTYQAELHPLSVGTANGTASCAPSGNRT
jgi:hypothetical protein